MENSPFGKLPPELRNIIYQHALVAIHPIQLIYERGPRDREQKYPEPQWKETNDGLIIGQSPIGRALALARVCKQIRQETEGLFFALNEIELSVPWIIEPLHARWLKGLCHFLAPGILPTQIRIRAIRVSVRYGVVLGKRSTRSSACLTKFMRSLRKQGAQLGWRVRISLTMIFVYQPRRRHTVNLVLPISGTDAAMMEVVRDLEETATDVEHRKGFEFLKNVLTSCISDFEGTD